MDGQRPREPLVDIIADDSWFHFSDSGISRRERRCHLALCVGEAFNPFNLFDRTIISAEILRTPDLPPSEKLVFTRLMHFLRSFPDTAHNPTGSQLVLSCIEERPAFQLARASEQLRFTPKEQFFCDKLRICRT